MEREEHILQILRSQTIEDYLSSHGITPSSISGTRSRYLCPLHGPEKTPSFFVQQGQDDVEYFKCFGCGRGGDLINLKAFIENRSSKDVVRDEARNLGLTSLSYIDSIANQMDKNQERSDVFSLSETGAIMIRLSRAFNYYLKFTEFDKEEIVFMESVMKLADEAAKSLDEDTLVNIYKFVSDRHGFQKRMKSYSKLKRERQKLKYMESKNG